MRQINKTHLIDNIYLGLLLVIFGGIVFHAPLSVYFSVLLPEHSLLIKSWKEILMLIAFFVGIYILIRKKRLELLKSPLILLIFAYTALHFLLIFFQNKGLDPTLAGLMIDLRYLFYFGLVYVAVKLYPGHKRVFINVGIAGALLVVIFAVMQVFILPRDVLKYIGYSKETISPYLTIDQNYDFIRINSTFRGPNPLGAYASIIIILLTAVLASRKVVKTNKQKVIWATLSIGGIIALWFSYSRSAWIGAVIGVVTVLSIVNIKKLSATMWINISAGLLIVFVGLTMLFNTPFFSNVILHEDPGESNSINSNEGHLQSLIEGVSVASNEPFGKGIGSTGSASLLGDKSQIIENQYLFIAHESGWLGLVLFMMIFFMIMQGLWRQRDDWLSLGVFAAGLSLAVIGLFLPVFADDPVAIIWWGLAALALFGYEKQKVYK